MAIDYDSGTGLFDVIGAYAKTIENIRENFADMIETRFGTHLTKRGTTQREPASVLLANLETHEEAVETVIRGIMDAASADIIKTVNTNTPLPSLDIETALKKLYDTMTTDAETLTHSNAGSSTAYGGSNTGTGKLVVSLTDGEAVPLHHVFGEDIVFECVNDAQEGGTAKSGQEHFRVRGEASVPRTHRDWPAGSGTDLTIVSASGAQSHGYEPGANILVNGNFEIFSTANIPDKWAVVTGTPGTNFGENANSFRGSKGFAFIGDGATLSSVRQAFASDTAGTPRSLKPNTRYAMGFWCRVVGSAATTGVLRLSVKDGGGTIIDSTNAYVSLTLSTVSSSYAQSTVTFRTGADVSSTLYLTLELTTALDSGKTVVVDDVVVCEMVELYTGGPLVALFSGGTDWVIDDTITLTVTQNNDDADLMQEVDRLVGLRERGLTLPGAGAGTISNSLIA